MKPPSPSMQEWYQQPPGSWLLTLECEEAARVLSNIKGRYLVQMGGTADLAHSAMSPILYQIRLMSQPDNLSSLTIQTEYQDLPLLPNSVDVVVIVHLLEFIDYPVKLLQEIFQALKPDGRLLIFGFNPLSLWGMNKFFNLKKDIPWNGKFWSRAQVKRWLINFNYSILFSKTFCYGYPRKKKPGRRLQLFSEVAGQLSLPTAGGIYLLVAKKSVYAPLLHKIVWKGRNIMAGGIVKPTPSPYR
ncbi:class I SAM-dependent methyltransferase [Coxiella burnetii]|uniref:class I SAM-dependent methyltransferase n=1 Tax=Coxiella burnetii TaxID=777 RepID=UPI000183CFD4|nr:class I SAM-dependent methyltransferase [Coxiella burnetii]ACJ18966.1 methyltransferase [Coxiella burnetii CbuG_Q212]ATN67327.1 methyltransferase [Coxiella burnetii]OYK85511.1 SAM-dependent methyltransferase [Coxiella burnetii]